jgi:penicillin-binding protein 2
MEYWCRASYRPRRSCFPSGAASCSASGNTPALIPRGLPCDPVRASSRSSPGLARKPACSDKATCTGTYAAAPEYRCYGVHGELTLPAALEVSCNVYFFELAHRVGLARFGLGKPSGLNAGEASGWVADPAWAGSHSKSGMQWDHLVGLGHGPLGVTLLELAVAYAELAERLTRPSEDVSDQMRAEILAALRRVVAGEHGTGRAAAVAGLEIAGKTGTAEPGVYTDEQPTESGQKENGWFVGFTPVTVPERVAAVLVLGGQGGGQSTAPIAGRIFARMAEP